MGATVHFAPAVPALAGHVAYARAVRPAVGRSRRLGWPADRPRRWAGATSSAPRSALMNAAPKGKDRSLLVCRQPSASTILLTRVPAIGKDSHVRSAKPI
jgi:hypothetical protein